MARSIYDLSDEDLAALSPAQVAEMAAAEEAEPAEPAPAEEPTPDEPAPAEEVLSDEEVQKQVQPAAEVPNEPQPKEPENPPADGTPTGTPGDAPASKDPAKAEPEVKPEGEAAKPVEPASAVNYETEYKRLLAPFKANGRDMQVQNVDEAIQLMQMGANYNRKMSALKPHLATVRMLETAGISSDQLNFLIDVHKKDPAAINKLVKESGIDPLDLSPEKADGYTPGNHKPHEAELAIDEVLQSLDGNQHLTRTMDIVANQWDARSKEAVAKAPQLIALINTHIEHGIYDRVWAEVERERTFGRLTGLPDLEAYRQVGDAMDARGAFATPGAGQPSNVQQAPAAPAVVVVDPKQAEDSKRDDKRRAAMPARTVVAQKKELTGIDIFSMSDEEFKQFKPNFS